MNSENTAPNTLTPEIVSAILRDPDSPLYPSQIGVYCDDDSCGLLISGDYMVSTEQTSAERLEVARAHMRTQGWQCDDTGDYCPTHATKSNSSAYVEPADRPAEWARMARDLATDGHSHEAIAAALCVDISTVSRLLDGADQ